MLLEGTLGRQVAVGGTSPWKTMLIYVMLIIWCLKKTDMLSIFTDAIIGNGGLGDRLQQLSSVAGSRGRRKKDDKQLETKYRYLIQNLNANNKIDASEEVSSTVTQAINYIASDDFSKNSQRKLRGRLWVHFHMLQQDIERALETQKKKWKVYNDGPNDKKLQLCFKGCLEEDGLVLVVGRVSIQAPPEVISVVTHPLEWIRYEYLQTKAPDDYPFYYGDEYEILFDADKKLHFGRKTTMVTKHDDYLGAFMEKQITKAEETPLYKSGTVLQGFMSVTMEGIGKFVGYERISFHDVQFILTPSTEDKKVTDLTMYARLDNSVFGGGSKDKKNLKQASLKLMENIKRRSQVRWQTEGGTVSTDL